MEQRICSLTDCSRAVHWRSLGSVKGRGCWRLGLTASPLIRSCSLLSVGLVWYSKITKWCKNTDIPSSPSGKVRPFSPLPTPCHSCPRFITQSWIIPCLHFSLLWLHDHVWYWPAGASGCQVPGPRDCVTLTDPAGIWTNPQQCPRQAVVITKVRKPGGSLTKD